MFTIDPRHADYATSLADLRTELQGAQYDGKTPREIAKLLLDKPQTGTQDETAPGYTSESLYTVLESVAGNIPGEELSRAIGYVMDGREDMVRTTLKHWRARGFITPAIVQALQTELQKTKVIRTTPVYGQSRAAALWGIGSITHKMIAEALA